MKVIFLDIDGVLNSIQFSKKRYEKYKKTGKWDIAIDDSKVKMLKEIIDKSGGPDEVKVVLSSSWRKHFSEVNGKMFPKDDTGEDCRYAFSKHDIVLYSRTGSSKDGNRGKEITEWMDSHSNLNITHYVVIDDETIDILEYIPQNYIVKPNYNLGGIDDSHVRAAIHILNNGENTIK